jgi:hypothetical protein
VDGALVDGASGAAMLSAGFWQPLNNPIETSPNARTK